MVFTFSICTFASEELYMAPDGISKEDALRLTTAAISLPPEYLQGLFDSVLELYINEHLYEFTREEAIEKFMYNLIAEHPEMYTMFLNTLLGTMDKYSAFHEKESGYLTLKSDNAGYGIVINETADGTVITKVIPGSQAESAGILAGDKLVSVAGIDVERLPWRAAAQIFTAPYEFLSKKGEDGKYPDYNPVVEVVLERNGEKMTVKMQKGYVQSDELSYTLDEEKGIAVITISSFISETLADEFNALVADISAKGYKKLTVDLRDNGGGSLELVLKMAETFVENGDTLCYINKKTYEEPEAVVSTTPKISFDSISVLINGNTASAAELMANILKVKAGAVLVGSTSYGKALGQTVYNLTTGDYITVTSYEVLDANSESYNDVGLVPDLAIENVLMLYKLPALEVFNHVNYLEITPGVYSTPCLAYEQRLEVIGLLKSASVDGIWDDDTKTATLILQTPYGIDGGGILDYRTVTLVTDLINGYKDNTYYEDSQLDVALLYHSSLSQAKRLIAEKLKLEKEQAKLIEENEKALEAWYDSLEG